MKIKLSELRKIIREEIKNISHKDKSDNKKIEDIFDTGEEKGEDWASHFLDLLMF